MDDKILKGTFVHLGEALLKSPRLPLFEQAAKKRYLLPQESPEQQSEKFSALRVLQKEFIDIYERELPV